MVPPLFAHALQHRPRVQNTHKLLFCTNPLTEANRQGLLSSNTISSCSFRIFFTACAYELSSNRSLSGCTVDRYSSLQRFFVLLALLKETSLEEEHTKKPFIPLLRTKSALQLSCYHLHSSLSHNSNLSKYIQNVHTLTRLRRCPVQFYSRVKRFLLTASGSFSR